MSGGLGDQANKYLLKSHFHKQLQNGKTITDAGNYAVLPNPKQNETARSDISGLEKN